MRTRVLPLLLAVTFAAACGGSSTIDGTGGSAGSTGGTGGSSGSGGSAGTGGSIGGSGGAQGGSGGSSGSAGSATDGGTYLDCFDEAGKLTAYDLKTCTADTCAIVTHQTDCCGNTLLIGVEQSHLAELEACEAAWVATLPDCDCASGPPQIEQPAGTVVSSPADAEVTCGNWTMSSGICITQPKQ